MDYFKATKAIADYNAKLVSGKKHASRQITRYALAREFFAEKDAEREAFERRAAEDLFGPDDGRIADDSFDLYRSPAPAAR
jgi:hypothetical protein